MIMWVIMSELDACNRPTHVQHTVKQREKERQKNIKIGHLINWRGITDNDQVEFHG